MKLSQSLAVNIEFSRNDTDHRSTVQDSKFTIINHSKGILPLIDDKM